MHVCNVFVIGKLKGIEEVKSQISFAAYFNSIDHNWLSKYLSSLSLRNFNENLTWSFKSNSPNGGKALAHSTKRMSCCLVAEDTSCKEANLLPVVEAAIALDCEALAGDPLVMTLVLS